MEKMEESAEIDNSTTINILNDDCLRLIFQYLPIVEKIKIEGVCKRWQKLSKESWYTFKRLDLFASTWGWPNKCEKKFIDNDVLHEVLIRCSQYLDVVDFSVNSPNILLYYVTIREICGRCPKLKSLNLSDLSTSRRGLNCPYTDSDRLIDSLLLSCQNFIKFGWEPCYSESNEEDLSRLFDKMRKVKYLRLGSYHRSLFIEGECLSHLPSETIEEIVLVKCKTIKPNFFRKACDTFINLQTLALCYCQSIDDSAMETISSHLDTLKAIGISGPCSVTERGMKNIIGLENLEKLSVMNSQSFTDNVLCQIAANCRRLEYLDISFCQSVTNVGILGISTLPKLSYLAITGTKNISDENLGKMDNLKYLEACNCVRLKDAGLCELVQRTQNLEILNIQGCEFVTDQLLVVAMNATKNRENGVILKISTSKTGMRGKEFLNSSPFLNVVKNIRRTRGRRTEAFYNVFFVEGEDGFEVEEY